MTGTRMTTPDDLGDRIAALEGRLLAAECVINALVLSLPNGAGVVVQALHATEALAYRDALASSGASNAAIDAFQRQTERAVALLDCKDLAGAAVSQTLAPGSRPRDLPPTDLR